MQVTEVAAMAVEEAVRARAVSVSAGQEKDAARPAARGSLAAMAGGATPARVAATADVAMTRHARRAAVPSRRDSAGRKGTARSAAMVVDGIARGITNNGQRRWPRSARRSCTEI
jgi:hypothetical protein